MASPPGPRRGAAGCSRREPASIIAGSSCAARSSRPRRSRRPSPPRTTTPRTTTTARPRTPMPEGDSIRRVADRLAPLVGQTLERVTTQGIVRDLAGRTIAAVHPHGKHLMIDLDDATQLRMHLGMNGRVRFYARD